MKIKHSNKKVTCSYNAAETYEEIPYKYSYIEVTDDEGSYWEGYAGGWIQDADDFEWSSFGASVIEQTESTIHVSVDCRMVEGPGESVDADDTTAIANGKIWDSKSDSIESISFDVDGYEDSYDESDIWL